jgi:hypothetical protein
LERSSGASRRDDLSAPVVRVPVAHDERPRLAGVRWAVMLGSRSRNAVALALAAVRQPAVGTWLANAVLAHRAAAARLGARQRSGDWIRMDRGCGTCA